MLRRSLLPPPKSSAWAFFHVLYQASDSFQQMPMSAPKACTSHLMHGLIVRFNYSHYHASTPAMTLVLISLTKDKKHPPSIDRKNP